MAYHDHNHLMLGEQHFDVSYEGAGDPVEELCHVLRTVRQVAGRLSGRQLLAPWGRFGGFRWRVDVQQDYVFIACPDSDLMIPISCELVHQWGDDDAVLAAVIARELCVISGE